MRSRYVPLESLISHLFAMLWREKFGRSLNSEGLTSKRLKGSELSKVGLIEGQI